VGERVVHRRRYVDVLRPLPDPDGAPGVRRLERDQAHVVLRQRWVLPAVGVLQLVRPAPVGVRHAVLPGHRAGADRRPPPRLRLDVEEEVEEVAE